MSGPPLPSSSAAGGPVPAAGSVPVAAGGGLYHERQRLELCALHALNNVLQRPCFTQEAADEICKRLAPDARLNPHRSLLGTGNYDVNVIMAALQSLELAAVWWDKRRSLERLALGQILGFILNVPSHVSLGFVALPLRRKHWLAVRQLRGTYYNLDSKLRAPVPIGGEAELRVLRGFPRRAACRGGGRRLVEPRVICYTRRRVTPAWPPPLSLCFGRKPRRFGSLSRRCSSGVGCYDTNPDGFGEPRGPRRRRPLSPCRRGASISPIFAPVLPPSGTGIPLRVRDEVAGVTAG
ncbi:josephin-1-like [Sarcoramphus papa]